MSNTDTVVTVEVVNIKGVKIDPVKKEITLNMTMTLNAETYRDSNKIAFWAFNEQPVEMRLENPQRSLSQLDKRLQAESA